MRRTAPVALLLVGLTTVAGCSGDDEAGCSGRSYQPDLGEKGAASPIAALEDWLGTDAQLPDPPDEDWFVQDSGAKDPELVAITNDTDDGWWVGVVKTDSGGWVVEQATADASGCTDLPES